MGCASSARNVSESLEGANGQTPTVAPPTTGPEGGGRGPGNPQPYSTVTTHNNISTTAPGGGSGGGGAMFQFNGFAPLLADLALDKEIEQGCRRSRIPKESEWRNPCEAVEVSRYTMTTLIGHPKAIKLCAVSPDENRLASACIRDNAIVLWDVGTRRMVLILDGHDDGVLCCAFSPDNRLLASGSIDNTLVVWDASTGKMLHRLHGHQYLVCTCGFSRDGSLIVSGSGDNSLIIWSTKNGLPLGTLDGHSKIVSSCSFSPCDQFILSASADRTLIIWDTKSGERHKHLKAHLDVILSCCYSPDGSRIVSNDKRTLKVWDTETGSQVFSFSIAPSSLSPTGDEGRTTERRFNLCVFSPDGRNVVSCSNDRTVTMWDPDTGQEVLSFYCRQSANALSSGPYTLISFGDEAGNIYLVRLITVVPREALQEIHQRLLSKAV